MPERVRINTERNEVDGEVLLRNCYIMREFGTMTFSNADE
jgi:hypothetical protein